MGETNVNHRSIFSMRFTAAPPSSRVPRGRTAMAKSIARLLVAAMAVAAMTLASVAGTGLAQAQTNTSTDWAALVALYNATDGDNWGNNTNWGSDMPLSGWHGVTTDSDGRVRRLYLQDNQLSGEVPSELGNLSNLEWLWLQRNQLSGVPPELGSLSNLESLDLSGNQLSGVPSELGSLSNLQTLWLSGNQLTGEIPGELGGLANLQTLWLSGNQLTGCIPQNLRRIETNDLSQLGLPFCDMPGAPTIATPIVPGDASLTVAWAVPINTGSSAITAYDLRYIETGAADKSDANWTVVEDVWAAGSGSLQYTLTGLTGGTQYDVQVRAVNAAGPGAWSATVTGIPASAVTGGDSLIDRYDGNGNNMIDKAEVIEAIKDYLFGEGDEAISKGDVIRLIKLYLFG